MLEARKITADLTDELICDKSIEEILEELEKLEEESERNGDAFEEVSHEEVFGSAWEIVNGHGV